MDEKYNAAKQTHKFLERFGKGMNISEEDLRKMNYFSRNHLTPHADFPLASEQELTYFFQNCVPGEKEKRNSEKLEYSNLMAFLIITGKQSMNQGVRTQHHVKTEFCTRFNVLI